MDEVMTWDEVTKYCNENRDEDRFCQICCSCSGPSYSNLAYDYPCPKGCVVLRGGHFGECKFVVRED